MSRTSTFTTALLSSLERLLAPLWKATRLPSPEIAGVKELSLAPGPSRPAPG